MQFLRTLLWVTIAVLIAIVAGNNWHDVTINLWSNLQADIKIPVLLLAVFLAGFLPTWLVMRGKQWRLERHAPTGVRPVPAPPAPPSPAFEDEE
jgi:lipopolysaccharide assembly protein A